MRISERQRMRVGADRLSLRGYLGYDFGDARPDHSSLTRIRARCGRAVFPRCFERIVERCRDAGLLWGKELLFDATRVQANAALGSLVPRFVVQAKASPPEVAAHLEGLFHEDPTDGQAATTTRDTMITRLACRKAAVKFLAPREEAKSTDVLTVAAKFEEWVNRTA